MADEQTTEEATSEAAGKGPIGEGQHPVKQGECMISIAERAGHLWEYLWDHAGNAQLKSARKDPTALLPGDRVHIPELRRKDVDLKTNASHIFRRRGVPTTIHIVLLKEGEARAELPYTLSIDGSVGGRVHYSGKTNGQGEIKHPLDPRDRRATLVVGEGEERREYELALGHLDPVTEITGVQARLNNLGFYCGEPNGVLGSRTVAAIQEFQYREQLQVTGKLDDATRDALKRAYGG